mmetsp:Transcript_109764/g.321347  ORF Transcript_109764/g.321347 Transcript_109764/m.321347 type:complete len:368 (-) Transcript_109764:74-1177(-)
MGPRSGDQHHHHPWGGQPRAAAGNWRRWREGWSGAGDAWDSCPSTSSGYGDRTHSADDGGGFSGAKINAVQIGLGTFATIIQNLVGRRDEWDPIIGWLLQAVSETDPQRFRGVAVEPVSEHVKRLRKQAANALPQLRLVQVAIGEDEAEDAELHVLTQAAHDQLLASVPPHERGQLAADLIYLRNMSCVDGPHPSFHQCREKALRKFGIDLSLEPFRTSVWSYGRLASSLDFCGCELLVVDAEGHDAKILRSMITHCREEEARGRCAWPDIVVFESAGLCDSKEGGESEADVIKQLESCGYFVLLRCKMNTDMVRREAVQQSEHLQHWVNSLVCHECRNQSCPMTICDKRTLCSCCSALWWESWNPQ